MVDKLKRIPGCDNPNCIGDVIFVHGLGGDALKTWQPKEPDQRPLKLPWKRQDPPAENHNSWLFWLGKEHSELAIWSLDYEAEPFKWRGFSMALTDRATNTLRVLQAERLGNRPLVFVTHSMGGLLVKQMIRHAWDYGDEKWQEIAKQIKGIVFLSTPHFGSNLANLIQYLKFLRTTVSVRELEDNAAQLRDLNQTYRNHSQLTKIPIQVYCEKKPTSGVMVVDAASADPGIQGVIPTPMDDDHLSICAPTSTDALVYKLVNQFIEQQLILPSRQGIPTLLIHGWVYQKPSERPAAELDWSRYFHKEPHYQIPDPSSWDTQFLPELRQIRDRWSNTYAHRTITLRGKLPLTALLGIGCTFPYVGGYDLEIEQPTNGITQVWRSQVASSNLQFQVIEEVGEVGDDLLIVFSVTGKARPQVEGWMQKTFQRFNAIIYLEPETGASNDVIRSNADAIALAIHAKSLLQHYRQRYETSKIHIILYGPASFSLFLGQQLNALGKVVAYEWNKDKGDYLPAISISV